MHKAVTFLFLCFLFAVPAFSQSSISAFDKARQIKMLESTRKDVRKIFADLKTSEEQTDEEEDEDFETESAAIEASYTSGDCSDESDDTSEWKISEGKVKSIYIDLNEGIKLEDFDFDLSGFIKEQRYSNIEDEFVYHNKNLGISFTISDDAITSINFFPSISYFSKLCENEEAEELKEFYSKESFFRESELKDRIFEAHTPTGVETLTVSVKNVIIDCVNADGEKICADDMKVNVQTFANDPQNDMLVYNYKVSGGTITGSGAKVVWDLYGVEPGEYTITAGVDDGCGVCGRTKTETVTVKICPDCLPK